MTINMKYVLSISIALAVLGFLVGAGSQFTDLGLDPKQVKALIALFVILLGMGNSVNSVLIAFGMNVPSRLAAAASIPEVKQIVTTQTVADQAPSDKVVGPPSGPGTK
jgi:hypothetical protein